MKRALIGGVALLALATTGCKRVDEATAPVPDAVKPVKSIYAFTACPPTTGEPIGVINIIAPNNFDGNKINRRVSSLKGHLPNRGNPNPDPPDSKPNKPNAGAQPFDIFIGPDIDFKSTDKGLVLVRVVLLNGKKNEPRMKFHRNGDFHGVGLDNLKHSNLLCGSVEIDEVQSTQADPPEGDAREIASFYLNLSDWDWKTLGFAVPFVIGLEIPEYSENPIFVDPKVRNDGGGVAE